MADIAWPLDVVPDESRFYLRPHTQRGVSPYTRSQQVRELSRPIWVCQMSFTRYMDETGPFDALIVALKGGAERVLVPDFRRSVPWGTGRTSSDLLHSGMFPLGRQPWSDGTFFSDGTGLTVEGGPARLRAAASAGDDVISTDGWWPNEAVLQPGDYLQIGQDFNMVAYGNAVVTDGAGRAIIRLARPLMDDYPANRIIVSENPVCPMRLAGDDAGQNQTKAPIISDYTVELVEDLPWLGRIS